jgi:predicted transcriptional regulator
MGGFLAAPCLEDGPHLRLGAFRYDEFVSLEEHVDMRSARCYFSSTCYKTSTHCDSTMKSSAPVLTRRERQIMDLLYKLERATVAEVLARMPGKPHYSTVRAQLRVLEEKGHVRHQEDGLRYVYVARRSALRHLIDTFFEGSIENVVAALLGGEASKVTPEELSRLSRLVARNRKENAR